MFHFFTHHETRGKVGKSFGNRLYWNDQAQTEFSLMRALAPQLTESDLVERIETAVTAVNPARPNVSRLDVERFFMRGGF